VAEAEPPKGLEHQWHPASHVSAITLKDKPLCIVVRDVPFLVAVFRLFDKRRQCAGAASRPMVTLYEQVKKAPAVKLEALGKGIPRTLGVRLTLTLTATNMTLRRATRCQVRYRAVGARVDSTIWEMLDPVALTTSNGEEDRGEIDVSVREDDGLELGYVYEFEVRVGDTFCLGAWSPSSKPHRFAVPPPTPSEEQGLQVKAENDRAEISWPAFVPEPRFVAQMPGFAQVPVDYVVKVYGGSYEDELITTFVTRETNVTVRALIPATAYSVTVAGHWARFDTLSCDKTKPNHVPRLMAPFVTASASCRFALEAHSSNIQYSCKHRLSAPLSMVSPHGTEPLTDTLKDSEMRNSTPPLTARPTLPMLVPLPPPKFTTRNPLSYSPLSDTFAVPSSRRPLSLPRRPTAPVP